MSAPLQLLADDPEHGVVRYARELAGALGVDTVGADVAGPGDLVHLHFTDRLWGSGPEAAAERIERLAARGPVTVTLHDVPQPSDGPEGLRRRAACFGRVARAARAVACNSGHEVALLREHVDDEIDPVVIPLPVAAAVRDAARPTPDDDIALLGFVYPGKGHREALDAVAGLQDDHPGLGVVALGRASAGHEADLDVLGARARRLGVRFAASGYLPDDELLQRARRARVPLAAHRHVSASGSIGSWIAAGRRPLVPDGVYARELEALRPGSVVAYDPDDVAGAISRALADPGSTWAPDGSGDGWQLHDVARAYRRWWSRGVDW